MIQKLAAVSAFALMLTFAMTGCDSDDDTSVADGVDPTAAEAYDAAVEAEIADMNQNPPQ